MHPREQHRFMPGPVASGIAILLLLLFTLASPTARGAAGTVLANSDFDFDDNDWMVRDLTGPVIPPMHAISGGAPRGKGGFILHPLALIGTFIAPAQYLGDQGDACGGSVNFSALHCLSWGVELKSGDVTMRARGDLNPSAYTNWQTVTVPLDPAIWSTNLGASDVTAQDLACVLAHLESLTIYIAARPGGDIPALDRVSLTGPKGVAKGKARPAVLDFGEVLLGTPATNSVTITNTGVFGKTRALHIRYHDVPDELQVVAPPEFCGVVIPGQAVTFQVLFSPTRTNLYDQFITLNTGSVEKPRFFRIRVKASVVDPGSTIAGTWYWYGYHERPMVITSAGRNIYECRWFLPDFFDESVGTVYNFRGTFNGSVWKGTFNWRNNTPGNSGHDRGTFSFQRKVNPEGHDYMHGMADSPSHARLFEEIIHTAYRNWPVH
jgi:hypothetical protein